MADKKISQLTGASTPLAGTEVLPIVQSGSTVKVSAADVTAGRAVSAASMTVSSGNVAFSSTAQRITADMSNATVSNRFAFQTSTTNGNTQVNAIPNGTSTVSQVIAYNSSDPNNASSIQLAALSTSTRLLAGQTGTGSYLPLTFFTNGAEKARIDTAGNVVAGASVALSTTATDGFLYVPTCAGTPTGTPTAITGMAPIVVNTTNNKLYFYSGGSWRDAGP
jgi:hypothetical protein